MSNETKHNTSPKSETADEMLDEYDFSQATRGNPYRDLNQSAIRIQTRTGDREIQIKTLEVLATCCTGWQSRAATSTRCDTRRSLNHSSHRR